MVIVTGANGKLGRLVVEELLTRASPSEIGVSVRDPAAAEGLAARGVRVRRGDYADPASLASAFEGGSRVLVVSSNTAGPDAVAHHRAAIRAARGAGAEHVLYTSHVGASPSSPFAPMPDHAATEEALRDSGVKYTVLRNGFYASSAMLFLGGAAETGELVAPEDGPVSWTAHADLAAATAVLLLAPAPAVGRTIDLTATATYDFEAIAGMVAEAARRPVRRVLVSDDAYREAMVARGFPSARAEMMVGMFRASRSGGFAKVDPALEDLLGRAPTPLRVEVEATVGRPPR